MQNFILFIYIYIFWSQREIIKKICDKIRASCSHPLIRIKIRLKSDFWIGPTASINFRNEHSLLLWRCQPLVGTSEQSRATDCKAAIHTDINRNEIYGDVRDSITRQPPVLLSVQFIFYIGVY